MSSDPVLHLLVGPNGAGKSTLFAKVLGPTMHLPFVNADEIAADLWPDDAASHAYDAAAIAAARRADFITSRRSFVGETVFSHESKLDLIRDARNAGFQVTVHVVLIPEELSVARVSDRVANGGHWVPEDKVRARFARVWRLIRAAVDIADEAFVYDNTRARTPFRMVAHFSHGRLVHEPTWPTWTPVDLRTE